MRNIIYKLNDSITAELNDDKLTVRGAGEIPDYSFNNSPWSVDKESIKTIVVESGITYIGENAFSRLKNLETLFMPDTIIGIGDCAFADCISLTEILLPDSLSSIGFNSFSGCKSAKKYMFQETYQRFPRTLLKSVNHLKI